MRACTFQSKGKWQAGGDSRGHLLTSTITRPCKKDGPAGAPCHPPTHPPTHLCTAVARWPAGAPPVPRTSCSQRQCASPSKRPGGWHRCRCPAAGSRATGRQRRPEAPRCGKQGRGNWLRQLMHQSTCKQHPQRVPPAGGSKLFACSHNFAQTNEAFTFPLQWQAPHLTRTG